MKQISSLFLLLVLAASVGGCGKLLDVGTDSAKALTPEDPPLTLSSFAEFPDFTPLSLVVVGDAIYVGGVAQWDPYAKELGRIVKFPLDGGRPYQVWSGGDFVPPLRTAGARIAFSEVDVASGPRRDPVTNEVFSYEGIDVFDTSTGVATRVPNVDGRDTVSQFALTTKGLYWTSQSSVLVTAQGVTSSGKPGFSIARWMFATPRVETLLELRNHGATYIVRDDEVVADLLWDGSATGYDDQDVVDLKHAAYRTTERGFELDRVFDEFTHVDLTNPNFLVSRIVAADQRSFFAVYSYDGVTQTVERAPRVATSSSMSIPASGTLFGLPVVVGEYLYWVSSEDHSTVRRSPAYLDIGPNTDLHQIKLGDEVASDPKRQVAQIAVSGSNVYWLSTSSFERGAPYRLMAKGLRP